MDLSTIFSEPVIFSGIGGFCYTCLTILEMQTLPKAKRIKFRDPLFYVAAVIYVFFGIVIGYAYFKGKSDVNCLLAIQIGISSPLFFRTAANIIPAALKNGNSTQHPTSN